MTLLYEKRAEHYQESASVLYEYMCDKLQDNDYPFYYIIDKDSPEAMRVPLKYRSHLVWKNSFRHYVLFFMCTVFIGTEQPGNAIDPYPWSPLARLKLSQKDYRFVFLQHGVYYMYGLGPQVAFMYKGKGFPRYGKIVCSSAVEAKHFTDFANFDRSDLFVCGIPKFDRATRSPGADKIVIMPTYRKWEVNLCKSNPTNSTYYQFVHSIVTHIPNSLHDKIVFLPHPVVAGFFNDTDLGHYIPEDAVYDEVLKEARLLITDWSSISYDAFYRGSNVVFCWEDKDECIERFGTRLMLNQENVFGDVSYSFDDLQDLVAKNYNCEQDSGYIERFRRIVEFHDGRNTNRVYKALRREGYLSPTGERDIAECEIKGVTKKLYDGGPRELKTLEVYDGDRHLVAGRDYGITYTNNIGPGIATVTIEGIGSYKGAATREYLIRVSAREFDVFGLHDMKYTGEPVLVSIECRYGGRILKEGSEYVLKYRDNVDCGVATVRVCGRGIEFGGEKDLYYRIVK